MNKQTILSSAITLAFSASLAAPVMAEPSLFDYKEATSSYEDAYVSGGFNVGSGNQGQTDYKLNLSLDYEKVFSSPNRNTKLKFEGSGERSRSSTDGAGTKASFSLRSSATIDNYFQPGSRGAFWYGKLEAGAQKSKQSPLVDNDITLTAGLGYGRVVNVTPMARSIRVIQALRQRGTLRSDPANSVYQRVAEIIAKEDQYKSRHGFRDYNQYWIGDMEKALGASLGASGTIRAYDVLTQERISTRKYGWTVRAGLGVKRQKVLGVTSDSDPAFEVGGEYHRPLNNQTQFSNEAIFKTILDDDKSYTFDNTMSLTHELTDIIDWENSWQLSYNKNDNTDNVTKNIFMSEFNYELTNQLDFNIKAIADKTTGEDDINKTLIMGVKYRLK